jgi:hypothetical protein
MELSGRVACRCRHPFSEELSRLAPPKIAGIALSPQGAQGVMNMRWFPAGGGVSRLLCGRYESSPAPLQDLPGDWNLVSEKRHFLELTPTRTGQQSGQH